MAHQLSDGPGINAGGVGRICTRCHGVKVTGKKRWTCKLCGGTGIQPMSEESRANNRAVLSTLKALTPPPCMEASTKEIFRYIRSVCAMPLTLDAVARTLVSLSRDGLIIKRREGHEALWSLSKANSPALQSRRKRKS